MIKWWNNDFDKGRVCFTKIINITFEEYLIDKGLKNCLPGMPNMEHWLDVYYFGKEDETKYRVVSFELEIIYMSHFILSRNVNNLFKFSVFITLSL